MNRRQAIKVYTLATEGRPARAATTRAAAHLLPCEVANCAGAGTVTEAGAVLCDYHARRAHPPCARCWKREPTTPGGLCDLCAGVPAPLSRAGVVRLCTARALVRAALCGLGDAPRADDAAAARSALEQATCEAWHEAPELMRRAARDAALEERLRRATAELERLAAALGIDLDAAIPRTVHR